LPVFLIAERNLLRFIKFKINHHNKPVKCRAAGLLRLKIEPFPANLIAFAQKVPLQTVTSLLTQNLNCFYFFALLFLLIACQATARCVLEHSQSKRH